MGNISTKDRLLKAALSLFVVQGITETTTRDIAAHGGVTEGAIYRHFPSKDALIQSLFDRHYQTFSEEFEAITCNTNGTIEYRIGTIVTFMCQLYDRDPALYRFLLLIQHSALPRAAGANPARLLRQLIEKAIAAGELPPQDPALSASMVIGTILQPALGLVHGSREGTMLEVAPTISRAAVAILNTKTQISGKRYS